MKGRSHRLLNIQLVLRHSSGSRIKLLKHSPHGCDTPSVRTRYPCAEQCFSSPQHPKLLCKSHLGSPNILIPPSRGNAAVLRRARLVPRRAGSDAWHVSLEGISVVSGTSLPVTSVVPASCFDGWSWKCWAQHGLCLAWWCPHPLAF